VQLLFLSTLDHLFCYVRCSYDDFTFAIFGIPAQAVADALIQVQSKLLEPVVSVVIVPQQLFERSDLSADVVPDRVIGLVRVGGERLQEVSGRSNTRRCLMLFKIQLCFFQSLKTFRPASAEVNSSVNALDQGWAISGPWTTCGPGKNSGNIFR